MTSGGASRRLITVAAVLCLCAPSTLFSQQTAKPNPSRPNVGTGAFSGVVTDAVSGAAIAGAIVSLTCSNPQLSLRTVTDSKGRFVFRNLAASDTYWFRANKSGYVSPLRLDSRGGRRLGDGEWVSDLSLTLDPPSAISGFVTDEKNEPVVNVPVHVIVRVPLAGAWHLALGPMARTDDRGFYRITGLAGGSYVVSIPSVQSGVPQDTPLPRALGRDATLFNAGTLPRIAGVDAGGTWLSASYYATPPHDPDARLAYPILYYPGVTSFSSAVPVEITDADEKRNIDFTMRPVRTAKIHGRVSGPQEVLSGLVVRLLHEGIAELGMGSEQGTALVRADGTFTLVGVPPGRYVLAARTTMSGLTHAPMQWPGIFGQFPPTPGFVSTTAAFQSFSIGAGDVLPRTTMRTSLGTDPDGYSAHVTLTVGDADVTDVEVPLQRGARISGRIVREDGGPLPQIVNVSVQPASGDPMLAGPAADRQSPREPTGSFTVSGLQRGQYFLRVSGLVKSIMADRDYTDRPFDATPGTDISNVVVTLTDKAATLSGTVRSRDGAVVHEGTVVVFPVDSSLWTNYGIDPPKIKAVSLSTVDYQIQRIPAGEYYVIGVEPSSRMSWHDPRFFPAATPLATRINIGWGAAAVQDLTLQRVVLK